MYTYGSAHDSVPNIYGYGHVRLAEKIANADVDIDLLREKNTIILLKQYDERSEPMLPSHGQNLARTRR